MKNRGYTHSVSSYWDDNWEPMQDTSCQIFKFSNSGKFCAVLDIDHSSIALWDVRNIPVLMTQVSLTSIEISVMRCSGLIWSYDDLTLGILAVPSKPKISLKSIGGAQPITSSMIVLISVATASITTVVHIPFIVGSFEFVPSQVASTNSPSIVASGMAPLDLLCFINTSSKTMQAIELIDDTFTIKAQQVIAHQFIVNYY